MQGLAWRAAAPAAARMPRRRRRAEDETEGADADSGNSDSDSDTDLESIVMGPDGIGYESSGLASDDGMNGPRDRCGSCTAPWKTCTVRCGIRVQQLG